MARERGQVGRGGLRGHGDVTRGRGGDATGPSHGALGRGRAPGLYHSRLVGGAAEIRGGRSLPYRAGHLTKLRKT